MVISKNTVIYTSLSAAVFVLLVWVSLTQIVQLRGNTFDFYPRWMGAQAFWQGQSPYSQEITEAIQLGYYGRVMPPTPEFDQQNSAYPAYNYLLLTPFTALPVQFAIALWMSVQMFSIMLAIYVWSRILRWELSAGQSALLSLALLLCFRYSLTVYLLAQFTGSMLLLISLGVWALVQRRDALAGVLMACSTIPPTIAAPLCVLILLLLGRWRALIWFGGTLLLLVVGSVLVVGWWIPDFIGVLGQYSRYSYPMLAINALPQPVLRAGLVVVLVAMCAVAARCHHSQPTTESLIRVVVVTTFTTLLVVPQTGIYYVLLLLPVVLMAIRRARRWAYLLIAVLLITSWGWQFFSLREYESLLYPLHVMIVWGLVVLRRPVETVQ